MSKQKQTASPKEAFFTLLVLGGIFLVVYIWSSISDAIDQRQKKKKKFADKVEELQKEVHSFDSLLSLNEVVLAEEHLSELEKAAEYDPVELHEVGYTSSDILRLKSTVDSVKSLIGEDEIKKQEDILRKAKEEEKRELEELLNRSRYGNSRQDKLTAYNFAEDYIKDNLLKSPSSAEFPSFLDKEGHVSYLGPGKYRISSWVNAKNPMGVMVRTRWNLTVEFVNRDNSVRYSMLSTD